MNAYEFLVLATHKQLIFRQFEDLVESDQRENQVPSGFWPFFQKQMGFDEAQLAKWTEENGETLRNLRLSMYASCWSSPRDKSGRESALMWKAYAPRGIAIKTEVKKLLAAKLWNVSQMTDISLRCEPVVYADDWNDLMSMGLTADVVFNRLFLHTKRRAFADENEVRFSFQVSNRLWNGGLCPKWFPICFDDLCWIDQVVTETSLSEWAGQIVEQLARSHGLSFKPSMI